MADKLTLDRHAMKDRSTAHLRIYVGGLTDSATVEELYNHFIPYGQINGIVLNRNFGFIQFENEASVHDAIAKADGSVYQGRSLNVRTANANKPHNREPEVVTVQPEVPPAVALSDNIPVSEEASDPYDSYGNYIGDSHQDIRNSGKDHLFVSEERETYDNYRNFNDAHQDMYKTGYGDDEYGNEEPAPYNGSGGGWSEVNSGRGRGRGQRGGPRGRGRGRGAGGERGYRDRSPVIPPAPRKVNSDWVEREGFGRYQHQPEYPRAVPVTERNDCEIIVVSKALTEYAEYIESRLKHLGIVVDLLFPMEDVPIGKVLGNIASRGCLYAILVMPLNQENRSLTLTILHGLPQEHRNMPIEDALQLLSRNFQEVQRGGPSGREAVYALLGQLADGRTLTVLQYDKVIEYLQERREHQVKLELGEPLTSSASSKTAVDLQQRILSILNDKKVLAPSVSPPTVVSSQKKQLLDDPTVRKALDSILQKFV